MAVLSGGNIDPLLLGKVIRHGMAAAGRYLDLRVRIPDRPGGLARLLARGRRGRRQRARGRRTSASTPTCTLDEVEVHLQLETRGEAHAERGHRLRERGYRVFE